MRKPEWGAKRICHACSGRYYDMHREPPVCPTCGVTYDPEALLKTRRARPAPAEKAAETAPLAVREERVVDIDADDTVSSAEVEVEAAVIDEDIEEEDIETVLDMDDEEE